MSKDPKKHDTDPTIEKSLESVRKAWSRIEPQEPPELLDQSVLNAARRELEAGRRRRPLRWLGGFATATVMILALSLLFLQDQIPFEAPVSKPDGYPQRSAADDQPMKRSAAEKSRSISADAMMRVQADAPPAEKPAAPLLQPAPLADSPVAAETEAAPQELRNARTAKEEAFEAIEQPPASVTATASAGRNSDAEAWIEKLLELLDSGQDEKLAQELAAFKRAYPDYPLPDKLQDH